MKKRKRGSSVQFWATAEEKKIMKENAKRNGMDDLSHYLRTLALAPIKLSLSISVPNVIEVSEAELKSGGEIRKEHKRAAG